MLIISLSGGTESSRTLIAEQLTNSKKESLKSLYLRDPLASPHRRANNLRRALSDAQTQTAKPPAGGLVIVHCLTEKEARLVRWHGGFLFHVYEQPSSQVINRFGDLNVTCKEKSFRHVLSPIDALSEVACSRLCCADAV